MPRNAPVKSSRTKTSPRISVGTLAFLHSGNSVTPVRVIEDRGFIGFGGRRRLRVEVLDDSLSEPSRFEVAEADLILRKPRAGTVRIHAK